MLLRNTERYREVLEVGIGRESHPRVLTEREIDTPTNGFFFDHNATAFGIGICRGAIFVLLEDRLVPYGPEYETQVQETGDRRVFTASRDGMALVRVAYSPGKPFWNVFAMEDEDVDGFLLIHNVLSSVERRAILVKSNNG
jgi:hypothetical protein